MDNAIKLIEYSLIYMFLYTGVIIILCLFCRLDKYERKSVIREQVYFQATLLFIILIVAACMAWL